MLSIGGFVDVAAEAPAFVLNRNTRIGSMIFFAPPFRSLARARPGPLAPVEA